MRLIQAENVLVVKFPFIWEIGYLKAECTRYLPDLHNVGNVNCIFSIKAGWNGCGFIIRDLQEKYGTV